MNQNRPYNCPAGRPGGRPPMAVPANVIGVTPCRPDLPCCSDVASGGIIIGGCANRDCDKETTLSGMPIAMAYVPWQSYGDLYQVPQALRNGTLFRELNLDFAGRRCN